MTSPHTSWLRRDADVDDPERIAIREALAFGKALYDFRRAIGLSVAELALRAGITVDEVECIEEGVGSVGFETHDGAAAGAVA